MIRIEKITSGRLGNKILQYHSLFQLGYGKEKSCVDFEENKYFYDNIRYINTDKKLENIDVYDIIQNKIPESFIINSSIIHNVFFYITKKNPRIFLKFKDEYIIKLNNKYINVGIHIRGDDIISKDGNNGREVHQFEYYKTSINFVSNEYKKIKYYLCSDDINHIVYRKVLKYLRKNKILYEIGHSTGNKNDPIYDLTTLSQCDILINSSSTFCICSGFLGKENKIIIHSKLWIEKNINHEKWNDTEKGHIGKLSLVEYRETYDNFWNRLYENYISNIKDFYYVSYIL